MQKIMLNHLLNRHVTFANSLVGVLIASPPHTEQDKNFDHNRFGIIALMYIDL